MTLTTIVWSVVAGVTTSLFINSVDAILPSAYFGGIENGIYLEWLNTKSYEHTSWLPSSNNASLGAAVHWTINASEIQLAVAARAMGWVGFGIAEAGGMRGADIIMYTSETDELVDSYVLDENVQPIPDTCQSWTLLASHVSDGFIIFEASRLLDSGDTQDRIIMNDSNENVMPTRVIAAWGDSSTPSYHGPYDRAKGAIRFMKSTNRSELDAFYESMAAEAEGSFMLKAGNVSIPDDETFYAMLCYSREYVIDKGVPMDQDLHIIGYDTIIDPRSHRSQQLLHHLVLYGLPYSINYTADECTELLGLEPIYAWAPGELPLKLPYNVGGPLGPSGYKSFRLEIHYNNPEQLAGQVDNSVVKIYYTTKRRQHDASMMILGDPFIGLSGMPVSEIGGLSKHSFECPGSCSSTFLNQSVNVIAESLHMHKAGVRMINAQIRNGDVIRKSQVQFFDFDQQGSFIVVQQPYTILPGDSFRTTCMYDTTSEQTFGLASSQEMCTAFILYYPRQIISYQDTSSTYSYCQASFGTVVTPCESFWNTTSLSDVSQLGRTFGVSPSYCPNLPTTSIPSTLSSLPSSPPSPSQFSGATIKPVLTSTPSSDANLGFPSLLPTIDPPSTAPNPSASKLSKAPASSAFSPTTVLSVSLFHPLVVLLLLLLVYMVHQVRSFLW